MRHVMVLGDQLTRDHGPLRGADPATTVVLTVESVGLVRASRAHVQKAALFFGALRRFAADLAADGFTVDHHRLAPSFEAAIAAHLTRWPGATLELMRPNDRGVAEALATAARAAGGDLQVVPNALRLVDDATFDAWARGRERWVMEGFYRTVRAAQGWLMDPDDPRRPEGGTWNLDASNRQVPKRGHRFAPPPSFAPDAMQEQVLDDVARTFPDHAGRLRPFAWPVTRAQALVALERFVAERLPEFGPFEDALVHGERALAHSQLSVPLNLGLLHPREVLEAVEAAYRTGARPRAAPERRGVRAAGAGVARVRLPRRSGCVARRSRAPTRSTTARRCPTRTGPARRAWRASPTPGRTSTSAAGRTTSSG